MRAAAAPGSVATPGSNPATPPATSAPLSPVEMPAPTGRDGLDQLARIEDKTARIEEKYARAEALLQRVEARVEAATSRMHHVASQADVTAVREQVTAAAAYMRRLPGLTALVSVAIVTSLLTAALVLVLQRYALP
jgi:division protein CdvB (Snf7/Vps24/ESCRT-III family)